ncbi:YjfB family protein [Piscibacillus halophilus]|uniref:Putative motility protein n=1 Tax=Piscibacillus halophilus TaxID=571933 RepID=A0A1H9IPV1_9BACI|nr:YjfB family protein [Piscibacillus halophilus]SEQ76547.1 Putative motility protein [Piscibacillus halophilus]
MDVAAASIVMSQSKLQQEVGVQMMSKAKEQMAVQSEGLQKLMESAEVPQHPNLGQQLDVKA